MRKVLFILMSAVVLITSGCHDKKIVKSPFYSFEINTWGMPGDVPFESFLYNSDMRTYSPRRQAGGQLKPYTLYILKYTHANEKRVTDTLTIDLTPVQVDSLYDLAYSYLSNFEIDNEIEIGKIRPNISDGASISVRLNYEGKAMECTQYRLKGISSASFGGDRLIRFINKKAPEKFRLY